MADAPLAQQILPRRLAAQHASTSISQQLDDTESDATHTQSSSPSPNRVTIKYGRKGRKKMGQVKQPAPEFPALDAAISPGRNGPTTSRDKGQLRSRKRSFPQDSTSHDADALDSPLTPVSDSDPFLPTQSPPTSPVPSSLAPRPFPLLVPPENGFNTNSYNAGSKRKRREPSNARRWKKKELGDFVWVLIDDHSRIFDHKTALEREHVWWPGRIKPPLPGGGRRISVYLYGQTPFKDIEVTHPTEDNIIPFNNSAGEACYQVPTYVTPSKEDASDVMASPRKKAKRDRHGLEELWNAAVVELNAERDGREAIPSGARPEGTPDTNVHLGGSDDEGLPEVGEMDWKASLATIPEGSQGNAPPAKELVRKKKGRRKGKRKATPMSEGESDFGIRRLEDDALGLPGQDDLFSQHLDESLQIPGEPILAKGSGSDRNYWPARILEYVPPRNKREKEGKYKIEYLDKTTSIVNRNGFYTSEEDGFGTCKLGTFESSYDDTMNDSETDDLLDSLSHNRYQSPSPASPPPTKDAFCELDVRSQFAYTKSILVAILNEQYAPARRRHDQFLKGGLARKSVAESAAMRGEMEPRSVGELQRWLCEWCLREGMLAKQVHQEQVMEKTGEPQVDTEASPEQLEITQSRSINDDVIESEEATPPPSSVITCTTLPPDGPSDSSSVDITMEDVANKASPLSALSSLASEEATPPLEDKAMNRSEESEDAMDSLSDLTELEGTPPSVPNPDVIVSEPLPRLPRQYGCPAFEALTGIDKLDYCVNVLLPEAILQILLWRKGLRTTTEMLSPDEEERLHQEGEKLLQVTDWVYDVVRLRHAHERNIAKENSMSSSQKSERGGGKLRNVGRVNYQDKDTDLKGRIVCSY